MKDKITLEAIYLAVNELGQRLSRMENRLTAKIDSICASFDTPVKNSKQELDKIHDRLDVMEAEMMILAGKLTKTQAEVKVLQNVK